MRYPRCAVNSQCKVINGWSTGNELKANKQDPPGMLAWQTMQSDGQLKFLIPRGKIFEYKLNQISDSSVLEPQWITAVWKIFSHHLE